MRLRGLGNVELRGCSHILKKEDCERLNYGNVDDCVKLLIEPRSLIQQKGYTGTVLQSPTCNRTLPCLYFKEEDLRQKIFFEIEQHHDPHGFWYEYDSDISEVAARIQDYRSEVFSGKLFSARCLERMAIAVLKVSGGVRGAIRWILFEETPERARKHINLSQFLLSHAYPDSLI